MDSRTLRRILDRTCRLVPATLRVAVDPVSIPRLYADPLDREVAALVAASLAYGRVDLFRPRVEEVLARLGPHPGRRIRELSPRAARRIFARFAYRFHRGPDVARFLVAAGRVVEEHGSLGEWLAVASGRGRLPIREGLSRFVRGFREREPLLPNESGTGIPLLPDPADGSACKRLNLLMRWMGRPDDGIDFGLWTSYRPAHLVIPLDVHVARAGRLLGLTRRRTAGWPMAEEITAGLARVSPEDPLRYDFHICHLGMLRRELPQ